MLTNVNKCKNSFHQVSTRLLPDDCLSRNKLIWVGAMNWKYSSYKSSEAGAGARLSLAKEGRKETHLDFMTTSALREAAVKSGSTLLL